MSPNQKEGFQLKGKAPRKGKTKRGAYSCAGGLKAYFCFSLFFLPESSAATPADRRAAAAMPTTMASDPVEASLEGEALETSACASTAVAFSSMGVSMFGLEFATKGRADTLGAGAGDMSAAGMAWKGRAKIFCASPGSVPCPMRAVIVG